MGAEFLTLGITVAIIWFACFLIFKIGRIQTGKDESDYHQKAIDLCRKGENPFPMLIKSHRQNLLYLKKQGVRRVKISTARDKCVYKYCSKLDGKTFDIDRALEEMPIPGECRSNDVFETGQPFCRCLYVGKTI